jgi:putative SOS response-associated peptidase YedK
MCARYSLTLSVDEIGRLFGVPELPNLAPRYNIAPTQTAPVVRRGVAGKRELALLRWGLVPSWARDGKPATALINARAETVAEKPSFRAAFKARRCLVPADGFYEWHTLGRAKQPYRIGLAGGGLFAMAGLWERWEPRQPGEGAIESFTIIVTDANQRVAAVQDRMPVILAPGDHEAWLSGDADAARALLKPYPSEAMTLVAVSSRVNNVRNDDALCIEPVAPRAEPQAEARLL